MSTDLDNIELRKSYLDYYCKNKRIADICCGPGWAGNYASNIAISVKYMDARIDLYEQDINLFTKEDIHNEKFLLDFLKDVDLIIYFGQFYHTSKQEQIIRTFTNSNAKELILESKILKKDDYNLVPEVLEVTEPTDISYLAYDPKYSRVDVYQPNLLYTINLLKKYNWNIETFSQTNNWKNIFNNMKTSQFILYAKK